MNYCLGTVQFGLKYGIQNNDKPSEKEVFNILDVAIKYGISVFDTATAYGDSENVLGDYFKYRNINCDKIKVVSKISSDVIFNVCNNSNRDKLVSALSGNVDTSLKRLKIDRLYALLYHDSTSVFNTKKIETLIELKSIGKVDKVGVSLYTPEEALKALEYNIDIIQVPYNLFDQRLDKIEFFKKAKDKNIEIYARSSLLQGLALMDTNNLPSKVLFAKEYIEKFNNLCKMYNIDRLEAAINYVASNSKIDYIVFGVDNVKHLYEYISCINKNINKKFLVDLKDMFSITNNKLVNPSLW